VQSVLHFGVDRFCKLSVNDYSCFFAIDVRLFQM